MKRTIGFTDIDYDKNGKQVSFFNLPSSVHGDAWGVIRVPITLIKNGSGPTVILQGGNHGDEYEGPIVLGEIIRELDPLKISGRLIVVPAINRPAVDAGLRVSPIDDLNFNRSFPGNPSGSATEQLAAFVNDDLFPLADAFIDLHSGGLSLAMIPSAIVEPAEDATLRQRIRAAVAAFGAPMNVEISNFGDQRTATASAVRAGLVTVGTEMAGAGTVSPEAVDICRNGVFQVLRHLQVLDPEPDDGKQHGNPVFHTIPGPPGHVFATESGVFEPFHALGDEVDAGTPAGRIHFLGNPGREPETLRFSTHGTVYGLRHPGRVVPGNCCAVLVQRDNM